MKRVYNKAIVGLMILGGYLAYGQSPTLPAKNYNIFVENDLKLSTNESEGPVACGGNLTVAGNYQVSAHSGGDFMVGGVKIGLLVGGKVIYQSGNSVKVNQNAYVKIGNPTGSNVWYLDQNNAASPIRITPTANYNSSPMILLQANRNQLGGVSVSNNPVFQSDLIDFAQSFQEMRASAASIAQCTGNVQLYNPNMQPIASTGLPSQVKIKLQNGVNYLNLSGADMNNVQVFTFEHQPSAAKTLVINVDAPGTFNWKVWNQAGIGFQNCPYIIYNFHNTTQLNIIGNSTVEGTVFAPFADIAKTVNQSNIEGQVIGKSLIHSGGEMHYAIFKPSIAGCAAPVVVAPTAGFSINSTAQCLANNFFKFTNTSTGDDLTYHWDFGDGTSSTNLSPTKTYATSGTYQVTLTATNVSGTNSATTPITVFAATTANITQTTTSSGAGSITKQLVLNNANSFNSYYWVRPGQGSYLFPDQSVVDFTFIETGYYQVVLVGVDTNGCKSETTVAITIASEDVSTGNDGGLESESLGDAVSKRYVQRKLQSISTQLAKTDNLIFRNYKTSQSVARTVNAEPGLIDMFPTQLLSGDVAHVTSPTDILDYTVANEVLSVDFSVDGKTKAVVLGVKTLDRIYNHTKASCDRLKGAEILNVERVHINGYDFLMQAIKQRNGAVEHAISFAIGKNQTETNYSLQTNWYVNIYTPSQSVYNMQVWSVSPEHTQKLVKDILNKLNGFHPVQQSEVQKMPETYVAKVSRVGIDLVLKLKSTKEDQSIEIAMDEIYSETHGFALRYNPVLSEAEQTIRIEIKDGYEYEGLVHVNGEVQDAFYHADGNWGLDYDATYTTINHYQVYNDFDRVYQEDELPVNRNVSIQAHSEYDYLTLYKSLLPAMLADDYTDYSFIAFKAKGSGLLEIGLVKSSVENWKHQYRANINVKSDEEIYYIPFSFFKSSASNAKIVADDLTMLTFTFLPVEAGTNDLDLSISEVKFVKKAPLGYEELLNTMKNEYVTYPNPTQGEFNCLLYSDVVTEATFTLRDISGKLIYSSKVNLVEGRNELDFNINLRSTGLMFMNIASDKTNYGTTKILFK